MLDAADLIARPLLPLELIALLGAGVLALGLFALTRGLKGAWLRLAAGAVLILALMNPAFLQEDRAALADVVALVIDESGSQTIEDRAEVAARTAEAIEAQLRALSEARGGEAPIEIRVARAEGAPDDGTRVIAALAEAVADVAPDRVAGAILITDGAVIDAERRLPIFAPPDAAPAPVHVLLTGRADEFDRRLVLEDAPGFGLVNESVEIRFRVEQNGPAPGAAPAPVARLSVDGRPIRTIRAPIGRSVTTEIPIEKGGATVVELRIEPLEGELTDRNNAAAFRLNGVRDRLRVLLVSGEPHAGERTWRNLLKSDPSVDLVHFTILRPFNKNAGAPEYELALIPFPTQELFEVKLNEFDLIVFDRYKLQGLLLRGQLQNVADYVKDGGAVLVSTGAAFAGVNSIYDSPLSDVLPAKPTSDVMEQPFRPNVTDLGDRHPVTRGLPGDGIDGAAPTWGRWFRQIDVAAGGGQIIMDGVDERPLLILDRKDDGRVAMLTSDHAWLWARGYDGGGPQGELLRRLAHWLMKEPELEEEALTTTPIDGGFAIERRSLNEAPRAVVVLGPDGATQRVDLEVERPGVWRGAYLTDTLGLHRVTDAGLEALFGGSVLSTIAVVGPPAPEEFANPISTAAALGPLVEATSGAVLRLAEVGTPEIRRVREGRISAGSDWIGLLRREAYDVRGVGLSALAPGWLLFALAGLLAMAAWRVEGR